MRLIAGLRERCSHWFMPWRRSAAITSTRSIQRRLERTGVVALLLGYGLLLAVNLQLFREQRYQRQLQTMRRAERLLRSSEDQQDPQALRRILSDFSSFDLVLWGHPDGFPAGLVMPQSSNNDRLASSPGLLLQAEARSNQSMALSCLSMTSAATCSAARRSTGAARLAVSSAPRCERCGCLSAATQWLLLLAAVLASLVSILINRGGIRAVWIRSSASATPGVRAFEFSAAAAFQPEQQPDELQPLAMAFNNLLDRLAESFDRRSNSPAR